jgi:Putative heavy-metal-binding
MEEGDPDPTHADRLRSPGFTSGLSINEFAACTSLGLEPLQFVQGYAVLAQTPPMYSGGVTMVGQRFVPQAGTQSYMNARMRNMAAQGYWKRYRCPHVNQAITGEHLIWGANSEQLLMHAAWRRGYDAAFSRMVEQAKAVGAHGVVGVSDARHDFAETGAIEYRVIGTAVRVAGAPESKGSPWTTHLAGPPLVNLIAGGYAPIAAMVERTWMAVWPYCLTKFFLEGRLTQRDLMGEPVQEVDQISDAKMKLVEIATTHVRDAAKGDPVYGMNVELGDEHLGGTGAWIMDATIRATRLRRFDPVRADLATVPTLTLS